MHRPSVSRMVGSFALPVLSCGRRLDQRHVRRRSPADSTPRKVSRNHLPRVTGEVLVACDVTRQQRALPEQPAPHVEVGAERHAPEPAAVDVRDPVVPGEPFVDERVIRGQQIQDAAILVDDAVEQELDLAAKRLPQVVVEIRIDTGIRLRRCPAPAGSATGRRNSRSAPSTSDRPPSGAPASRASPVRAAVPAPQASGARRPACCSRGRTTAGTPAPGR